MLNSNRVRNTLCTAHLVPQDRQVTSRLQQELQAAPLPACQPPLPSPFPFCILLAPMVPCLPTEAPHEV